MRTETFSKSWIYFWSDFWTGLFQKHWTTIWTRIFKRTDSIINSRFWSDFWSDFLKNLLIKFSSKIFKFYVEIEDWNFENRGRGCLPEVSKNWNFKKFQNSKSNDEMFIFNTFFSIDYFEFYIRVFSRFVQKIYSKIQNVLFRCLKKEDFLRV